MGGPRRRVLLLVALAWLAGVSGDPGVSSDELSNRRRRKLAGTCSIAAKLHAVPRFNGEDRKFDPSDKPVFFSTDVFFSILGFSLLLSFLFSLYSTLRKCCLSCFDRSSMNGSPRIVYERMALVLYITLVVFFSLFSAFGATRVLNASRRMTDELDWLAGYFDAFDRYQVLLQEYAVVLETAVNELTCVPSLWSDQIEQSVDFYEREVDRIARYTGSSGRKLERAANYTNGFGKWSEIILVCMIVLLSMLLLPSWISDREMCFRRRGMNYAAKLGFFIILAYSIIAAGEWSIAVKMGDFCVDADNNFLALAENKLDDAFEFQQLQYYVECSNTTNPVGVAAAEALSDVQNVASFAAAGASFCTPSSAITTLLETAAVVEALLTDMVEYVGCEKINEHYRDLRQGFCCSFSSGLVRLGVVHSWVIIFLHVFLWFTAYVGEALVANEYKEQRMDSRLSLQEATSTRARSPRTPARELAPSAPAPASHRMTPQIAVRAESLVEYTENPGRRNVIPAVLPASFHRNNRRGRQAPMFEPRSQGPAAAETI